MPRYDYHCKECGTVFLDIEHSANDWPLIVCPECHMSALQQDLGTIRKTGIKMKKEGNYSPSKKENK